MHRSDTRKNNYFFSLKHISPVLNIYKQSTRTKHNIFPKFSSFLTRVKAGEAMRKESNADFLNVSFHLKTSDKLRFA